MARFFSHEDIDSKKLDFAVFLDILHEHSKKEDPPKEIMDAFRAHDTKKTGKIQAGELKTILMNMGERLQQHEVDSIFKEANVDANGQVDYKEFVRIVNAPLPDYF